MLEKLEAVERRYRELEGLLGDPDVIANRREYARLAKEHADLSELVSGYREWRRVQVEIDEGKALLQDADADVRELAKAELPVLREKLARLEEELKRRLVPKDPNDDKNVIVEIRAGTGGEEASLFAAELARMYTRYAEAHGWRVEVMSSSPTGLGGFKEIIVLVEGQGAYSRLKYEGGVHRVQRVPVTEAAGRIHTSAVTVAVLPEADEVEVRIDERELRIDVFRSSGPGGQSVNTTDSAVRITHLPTGIVVSCQDEKSQHKNKAKGMKILRARLLERAAAEQQSRIAASRRSMVGTGDRSERIRTYNFREGRLTDHRIGLTVYTLDRIMEGELEPIIDALATHHQAEALKAEHPEKKDTRGDGQGEGGERPGDLPQ
jgi:peptide chain release factor 1